MGKIFKKQVLLSAFILALFFVVIHPGGVRASEVKKVAVLPWGVNAPEELSYLKGAMVDMISSRVGAAEGVEIARRDEVNSAVKGIKKKSISTWLARQAGRKLKVDYVLYGSISLLGESLSIDARLLDVKTNKVERLYAAGDGLSSAVNAAERLSNDVVSIMRSSFVPIEKGQSYAGKFGDEDTNESPRRVTRKKRSKGKSSKSDDIIVVRRSSKKKALKYSSEKIKELFVSMATADLDGDSREEFILVSPKKVVVANYGPGGFVIEEELTLPGDPQFISVTSGDGEVFVSLLLGEHPHAAQLIYNNGYQLNLIPGANHFVRAVEIKGRGTVLLGQGFSFGSGYKRSINIYEPGADGHLVETSQISLPQAVIKKGLFAFKIFDIDADGESEVVSFGRDNVIVIYKSENGDWDEYWRSPTGFGGSLNEIVEPDVLSEDTSSTDETFLVESPFLFGDFNGDGTGELLIRKNDAGIFGQYSSRIRSYKSGALVSLSWNIALLEEQWRTKEISGYLADFTISDIDGDGKPEITMLIVEGMGSLLKRSKERSYLLTHKIF